MSEEKSSFVNLICGNNYRVKNDPAIAEHLRGTKGMLLSCELDTSKSINCAVLLVRTWFNSPIIDDGFTWGGGMGQETAEVPLEWLEADE